MKPSKERARLKILNETSSDESNRKNSKFCLLLLRAKNERKRNKLDWFQSTQKKFDAEYLSSLLFFDKSEPRCLHFENVA